MNIKILIMIFSFLPVLLLYSQNQIDITAATYNIRYTDKNEKDGDNEWETRKENVLKLIKEINPDILGTQEGLLNQLKYLEESLPEYEWLGEGRDGENNGEFSAIFYKKDKFELQQHSTFWISETPDTPSKSWDASLKRILTFAKFKDNISGKIFYHFNTHFDHFGIEAREESAKFLVEKINKITSGEPVIVTGDFNFLPDSNPYEVITTSEQFTLNDSKEICRVLSSRVGSTFNGFEDKPVEDKRIDYIFVSEKINVLNYKVIDKKFNNKYPSDHFPVVVKIQF